MMKRSIKFLLLAMLISVLIPTAAMADTNNTISALLKLKEGSDLDESQYDGTRPQLFLHANNDIPAGASFRLTLSPNAKWSRSYAGTDYTVELIGEYTAHVSLVNGLADGSKLGIPLRFYIDDGAEVTMEITHGESSGITHGKYVVLNAGRLTESAKLIISAKPEEKDNDIIVNLNAKATKGVLKTGEIVLVVPSGFTLGNTKDISLSGTGSLSGFSLKNTNLSNDKKTLTININDNFQSSAGELDIKGIVLTPEKDTGEQNIVLAFTGLGFRNVDIPIGKYTPNEKPVENETVPEEEISKDNEEEIVPQKTKITMKIGSNELDINGVITTMDTAPRIDQNTQRTIIPLSFSAEGLGIPKDSIKWIPEKKQVIINYNDREIILTKGSNVILTKNKFNATEETIIDQEILIIDNRMYIPYRAVAELLDVNVSWDANTKTITLEK